MSANTLPILRKDLSAEEQISQVYEMIRETRELLQKQMETMRIVEDILRINTVGRKHNLHTIVKMIEAISGHSSKMPDIGGKNSDHDKRYINRDEFRAFKIANGLT